MPDFDIERPACFYLGREYDLTAKAVDTARPPVMYDARDLLTHGVIVGMTGSGKTGLAISLLEEAAIDHIPCILIDPKGDLTNLLLQFPDLAPADFLPWLDADDARRRGIKPAEYAEQLAERWKQGLADTHQTPDRVRLLKDAGEWVVFTPGGDAGVPLSVLKTFAAPDPSAGREAMNQKIDATASALLGLTGVDADPVQSREHILIAQILLAAWSKGEDLDLATLIGRIQTPPMKTVGAFDIETFYPEKDRLKLAVKLNHVLASPSFSSWIEGEGLDIGKLLAGGQKTRHLIFSVAHLDDAQRMFFVTLLLEEVLAWTRRQSGTTSLRAILYFDEVYGYLPPHPANPPSKQPLMTLLKQARAFGVGVLLATQNPVDLDYKALSNAGTWMVGKLQTERDKLRLLDGLEGVAAERGTLSDRKYLESAISGLGNRVFLLHNVHQGKPLLFQTRQALSFLRGPMTREQVAGLMKPFKEASGPSAPVAGVGSHHSAGTADARFKESLRRQGVKAGRVIAAGTVPPVLPSGMVQFYLPVAYDPEEAARKPRPAVDEKAMRFDFKVEDEAKAEAAMKEAAAKPSAMGGVRQLLYLPRLLGRAEVTFFDKRRDVDERRVRRLLAEPPTAGVPTAWHAADQAGESLADGPRDEARWGEVPDVLNTPKKVKDLAKLFADWLYANEKLRLFEAPKLKFVSRVGEDAESFRARARAAAVAEAESECKPIEAEYAAKITEARAGLPPLPTQAAPASWLDPTTWFGPQKVVLGNADEARALHRKADEKVKRLREELDEKKRKVYERWKKAGEECEEVLITPRKTDVRVHEFGLAWVPFWSVEFSDGHGELVPAWRPPT